MGIVSAQAPLVLKDQRLSIDLGKLKKVVGSGSGSGKPVLYDGGGGLDTAFKTISVSGQSDLNAVQYDKETLTLIAGIGIGITTDAAANSVTIRNLQSVYWGSFWDTTTQTNAGTTAANAMRFNNTDSDSIGVTMVSGSRLTFLHDGVYNIQFSAQFDKPDAGDDEVEIWFSKNGQNISDSSTVISLHGNNGKAVPSWNYLVKMNKNDYFEIYWHSIDADMRILARPAQTDPIRPAIPSIILTAHRI